MYPTPYIVLLSKIRGLMSSLQASNFCLRAAPRVQIIPCVFRSFVNIYTIFHFYHCRLNNLHCMPYLVTQLELIVLSPCHANVYLYFPCHAS